MQSALEKYYSSTKKTLENLRRHAKQQRVELNETAERLLDGKDEYIFSTGDLVIKKPTNHTATKIKK